MAEENMIPGDKTAKAGVDCLVQVAEECPLRRVLAIREQGMVVESARAFEVGSTMVLGCHVDRKLGQAATGFVSAEVIVVDSRLLKAGADAYQVTVLYSDISDLDRETLLSLPDVDGIRLSRRKAPTAADGSTQRVGLAIPPPEVFAIAEKAAPRAATAAKTAPGSPTGAANSIDKHVGAKGADDPAGFGQAGCFLN